jgi:cell division protein FtsL
MHVIEKKLSDDELKRLITDLERSTRILKKILFI